MSMPPYYARIVEAAFRCDWTGQMLRDAAEHVDQIREEERILAELAADDAPEEPA